MYSIATVALILLLFRLGSDFFMTLVIKRQWSLLKIPIPQKLRHFRLVLFGLSIAIFIGNMIPIVVDAATLFIDTSRPAHLSLLSLSYALSNATTSLISAYLIWTLYRLAADTKDINDLTVQGFTDRLGETKK